MGQTLVTLGFEGVGHADTGRPAYHPADLLKLYIYGDLNRIQSSRRLEREAQRSIELMWLTGRPAPGFKTVASFRKDNGVGYATSVGSLCCCAGISTRSRSSSSLLMAEHPFGTLKAGMGATHFLTKTLDRLRTEMSLHVLAYTFKRLFIIMGAELVMKLARA